jgi:hypothetical protein
MTSREARACGPKKTKRARAHFSADHDQQVLTFREWCDLNSISARGPKKSKRARAHFSADHDQQILTFREWCDLNSISARTGRRILKAPGGPTVTMLTSRRFGISIGNNKIWQASRAKEVARMAALPLSRLKDDGEAS